MLALANQHAEYHPGGVGLILDPSLTVHREVRSNVGSGIEDMHEFNVIESGTRALMLTHQSHLSNVNFEGTNLTAFLSIGNHGFVEIDVATGDLVFEWWALGHIDTNESYEHAPVGPEREWDWL